MRENLGCLIQGHQSDPDSYEWDSSRNLHTSICLNCKRPLMLPTLIQEGGWLEEKL